MPHVAILVDYGQPFASMGYCLLGAVELWRAAGLEVEVYDRPGDAKDADLAILHVDLTEVPVEYRALAARYPRCLNRFTSDISKRANSLNLVRRGDGFAGPVIVKSNRNCGGAPEAALAGRLGRPPSAAPVFLDYKVFDDPSLVPEAAWMNPAFVVEKFLPEREENRYCVRLWTFLGSSEIAYRCQSDEPIVKGANTIRREVISDVPEELRVLRAEMGFDYGKFDFGLVEGRPVLYDVNRTPTVGKKQTPEERAERYQAVAAGIWEFLPASARAFAGKEIGG